MRLHSIWKRWMSVTLTAAALPAVASMPAALTAGVFLAAPALAQDAALMHRLVELTRRKGYRDLPMGRRTCEHLGLSPAGDCRVYAEVYVDPYGSTHSFNTFAAPGPEAVLVFVLKDSHGRSYFYVADANGKLLRAAAFDRKRTFTWSALSNESARSGFEQELSYWRLRQNQIEHERDR
jgi:hypothetical protein